MAVDDGYTDNLDEVLKSHDDFIRHTRKTYRLTESNTAEYAVYLHHMEGYYVFNPREAVKRVRKWIIKAVRVHGHTRRSLMQALEAAGLEDINFLRSVTSQISTVPYRGETRRTHPGNWADRRSFLVKSYQPPKVTVR